MGARSESSFRRPETRHPAFAATAGTVLFGAAWALLHTGLYAGQQIVDTPVYQRYGDAILAARVPYRDFALEYPPGALPVFVLPSLAPAGDYGRWFEVVMWVCGAAAIWLVAAALARVGTTDARTLAAVAFVALAPLALGSVILSRYDLWPAALTAAALAGLAADRERLAFAALALAAAAKIYPLVLLPLAFLYVARRAGFREAGVAFGFFAAVLAAVFLPFALVAPDGLAASLERQAGRPLQIESLGSAILLAADRGGGYDASVVSSHGSQNLAGSTADTVADAQTVLQALALAAVWLLFWRSGRSPNSLLTASAAAVTAFVAFGKVLSPQFLIWLVPLVPLVAGVTGVAAAAILAAALVLTHAWFPSRYWDLVALEPDPGQLLLARDLLLVALYLLLATAIRGALGPRRTA